MILSLEDYEIRMLLEANDKIIEELELKIRNEERHAYMFAKTGLEALERRNKLSDYLRSRVKRVEK